MDGTLYLSLAEVEVFGEGPDPAYRTVARQSSEYFGLFPAGLAIDGNPGTFTHTDVTDQAPSWELDLGFDFLFSSVALHNRADCCGSRLRDITVFILGAAGGAGGGAGGEIAFESDLLNPENALGAYPDGPPVLELDLVALAGGPVQGSLLRVTRTPDPDLSGSGGQGDANEADVLALAEVEVFGEAAPPRPFFHRGDTDDSGGLNLTDGVRTLNFLFLGGPDTACKETQDFNNDGSVNITDGVALFNFLFLGGPAPADPGPTTRPCGPDPDAPGSARDLGCATYDHC